MAKYSMRNGRRYEKPVQEQQQHLEQKEQTPAKNPWLDFFLGFITIVPFMHVRHILEEGISGHKEHKVSGFAFLIFMFIIGILYVITAFRAGGFYWANKEIKTYILGYTKDASSKMILGIIVVILIAFITLEMM